MDLDSFNNLENSTFTRAGSLQLRRAFKRKPWGCHQPSPTIFLGTSLYVIMSQ